MYCKHGTCLAAVLAYPLLFPLSVAGGDMSFADIVQRLTTVKHLAVPPEAGERSGCVSTTDKRATYNEETGRYENWFANDDATSLAGTDKPFGTLCKLEGPGVIWRIWSAQPRTQGHIEIFVDGASEPTLKQPFNQIFLNERPPPYPELSHMKARGLNRYVPIAFQKSIEIQGTGDWGRYCQISYTLFPEGTHVPSFTGAYSEADQALLHEANDTWAKRGPRMFAAGERRTGTITLGPGTEQVIAEWKSPAAINSFALTLPQSAIEPRPAAARDCRPPESLEGRNPLRPRQEDEPGGKEKGTGGPQSFADAVHGELERELENCVPTGRLAASLLRELTISIYWDGEETPSVWAPLGDFFGTAGGLTRYRSLMTGVVEEDGQNVFYANWYMPFKSAKIVIGNDGAAAREIGFEIHSEPLGAPADELLRFHCKWHRDDFSGFDEERLWQDRWPDWPVLKVDGASGRFCGFMAHMWNPNHPWNVDHHHFHEKPFPTRGAFLDPNSPQSQFYQNHVIPRKYWWGEGDEKFFVDGEKMPSTFGTGIEDYFGYAWGSAEAFDSALQAQVRNGTADEIGKSANKQGPGNIGHIVNLRWQVPDSVPFQECFEATIEKYHPNSWPLLNAYTVSWYQQPGTPDYYKPRPLKERDGYYAPARKRFQNFATYLDTGYDQPYRPLFHFTSRKNWINDPNGLMYYDGEYHLFFQHNPLGTGWGNMTWGHAVSSDMVHWQQLPHAITPYGKGYVFSGTGVVDHNNSLGKQVGNTKTLVLLYSYAVDERPRFGVLTPPEKTEYYQGLAYSTDRGRTFTLLNDGSPVIPFQGRDVDPKGTERDPKLFWHEPTQKWVAILWMGETSKGRVRFFTSDDLQNWTFESDMTRPWAHECFDLVELSVVDDAGNATGEKKWLIYDGSFDYEVGSFDGKRFTAEQPVAQHKLGHWNAAQTFNNSPDGRTVIMGWLVQAGFHRKKMPFAEQLSFPATMELRKAGDVYRLHRWPIREIANLYADTWTLPEDISIPAAAQKLAALELDAADLSIVFEPKGGDVVLDIRGSTLTFKAAENHLHFISRSNQEKQALADTKTVEALKDRRDLRVQQFVMPDAARNGVVNLRILIDRGSFEIFLNDGITVLTHSELSKPDSRAISISGGADAVIKSMTVNSLRSSWE